MRDSGGGAEDRGKIELSTWQEIADYLRVSIRTAQIYERDHELPVHRLPGGRSRVWAYRAELDAWKKAWEERGRSLVAESPARSQETATPIPDPPDPPKRRRWPAWLLLPLLLGIATVIWIRRPGEPTQFRVDDHSLIAEDHNERVVWRYRFEGPLNPDWYRASTEDWLKRGDLDGDPATTEFVFRLAPRGTGEAHSVSLVALTSDGKLMWTFAAGRRVKAKRHELSDLYDVNSFAIVPSRKGRPLLAFSANHASVYPNQVGTLNGKTGKLEREYWHSGHLLRLGVHDWDGDGEPEIILTGTNIGRADATLIMLDPLRMAGASVQPAGDSSQLEGFEPGVERAVVRFPRSCMAKRWVRTNRAARYSVLPSGLEVVVFDGDVESGAYLVYSLDRSLTVVAVDPSPDFVVRHHKQQKDGDLDHEYSPNELQELGRQVIVTRGR